MSDTIDTRSYNELQAALTLAQHTVYKQYLTELSRYPLVQPNAVLLDEEPQKCIRAFQLTELTCRKGEDIFQKLSTVYHASMSQGCSLFVMIDVESVKAPAKIYFGVRSNDDRFKQEEERRPARLMTACKALQSGLESNFPGSKLRSISASAELPRMLDDIFGASTKCISSVSCVASSRKKDNTENKTFIQGIERLIDAMRGHTYTALLIAEPVTPEQQSEIRNGYESLYSTLSSFRKSTWSYNENESKAVMDSLSKGIAHSVTEGTSHTQSHTTAKTKGTSNTVGIGVNIGGNVGHTTTDGTADGTSTTKTTGKSSPTKVSRAGAFIQGASGLVTGCGKLALLFPPLSAVGAAMIAGGTLAGAAGAAMQGSQKSESIAETINHSVFNSVSRSMGITGGLSGNFSRTWMQSTTESDGTANTTSHNDTNTTSESKTTGTTDTTGSGRTLQIENTNKPIEELLKRIEEQLVRVREGEDYGAYSCGAYFLSGKQESSILAANTYRALMLGEGSSVESGAINTWTEQPIVQTMKEYLRRFEQPVFALPLKEEPETEDDLLLYSPGTIVSGLELPLHLGVPTKSVIGLPVIEHAEFGRNVHSAADPLVLGKLYHMGQEEQVIVSLSGHSLASHTFITGSTGAGKSNTVYHLLDELDRQRVNFLVIEPAKGEYKNVFGGRKNISVYGTNVKKAPLLRLNPFSFPEDTHVLEHIDRLVEIFNACWPMYAAMPAVLKDAVEQAYRLSGWDLTTSINASGTFPTFNDLLKLLPEVVQRSGYSADTQNDYIGALYTRIKSLTNGINGQIFCSDEEIPMEKLFDENVIVDLSRVGSMETKSLLMGVLVLKLQEHRMAGGDMNADLRHVTVLEEAHNLLRRTSDVQTQESSNLQGKSVEMIANAIAEMRTYGEGFIIADQAPGLVDPAVIRNTNTKIIMRLPDESDRELVGKAASLNDDQIVELTKLPLGVAAVYQNDWLEPVLCKIDEYRPERQEPLDYIPPDPNSRQCSSRMSIFIGRLINVCTLDELTEEDVDKVADWIDNLAVGQQTKSLLTDVLYSGRILEESERRELLYRLVHGSELMKYADCTSDKKIACAQIEQIIAQQLDISERIAMQIRMEIFLYAASRVDREHAENQYQELLRYGGVR